MEEFDDVAPIEQWTLGARPGEPVWLCAQIDGKMVKRLYCPISMTNNLGSVTFAIKIFKEKSNEND